MEGELSGNCSYKGLMALSVNGRKGAGGVRVVGSGSIGDQWGGGLRGG